MKKILTLLAVVTGLSACLPYNNQYSNNPGYYPQAAYNNGYQVPAMAQKQQMQQAPLFEEDLSEIGFSETATVDNFAAMQQRAIPVQQVRQQTIYQELPQNPMYQQQMQQAKPYYNPTMAQPARGVVGVGKTLPVPLKTADVRDNHQKQKSKLIMPRAWRMAHPSIGKGLELSSQAERLAINQALNVAAKRKPVDVKLARQDVTILSLTNSSSANAQGFLCKDVYILKANNGSIEKMWGKFCRHPNWNEWVLTAW